MMMMIIIITIISFTFKLLNGCQQPNTQQQQKQLWTISVTKTNWFNDWTPKKFLGELCAQLLYLKYNTIIKKFGGNVEEVRRKKKKGGGFNPFYNLRNLFHQRNGGTKGKKEKNERFYFISLWCNPWSVLGNQYNIGSSIYIGRWTFL
jgi:hypothetical protein